MAEIAVLLFVLLSIVDTGEFRTLRGIDIERLNTILDGAKAKFSSPEYSYLDDPSPGDYFDSIVSAAQVLKEVLNETGTSEMMEKREVIKAEFTSLFKQVSSTTDEQAAPFGLNECWLLPANLSDINVVPILSAGLNAMQAKLTDDEGMLEACETMNTHDVQKTLTALMGKDCEGGTVQNGTTGAARRQRMMQYAEAHPNGGRNENHCLHLFVARYSKSEAAVQMFKRSFDKYLLAMVTVQSFCLPFVTGRIEEALRAEMVETHASFAASVARTSSIQLNKTTPWKCDDTQQVIISKMKAACERVKSTAASGTYFLEEMTAEEFENSMFEMAAVISNLYNEAQQSFNDAKTPWEEEAFGRTWSSVLKQMEGLVAHLASFRSDLSMPFGKKDDGLLPKAVNCDIDCNEVFPVYKHFNALEREIRDVDVCSLSVATVLKDMNEYVAPRCQDVSTSRDFQISIWRGMLLHYAKIHNFDGCEENRCLQFLIARYTNQSKDALEKLRYSLHRYVLLAVFLKSLCDSSYIGEKNRSELRNETLREGVIDEETKRLKPTSWEDRQGLHEAIAKRIEEHLRLYEDYMNRYTYVALVHLPYAQFGFIKLPNNMDVVRNESEPVKYVVSRRPNAARLNVTSQWAAIGENASDILQAAFSTRATNLTSQMEDVDKRFGPFLRGNGFRALAALRCAYEFVWYELAYRYFPAGYATGNHTLFTDSGNKYSDKCGQIVFFP